MEIVVVAEAVTAAAVVSMAATVPYGFHYIISGSIRVGRQIKIT